MTLQELLDLTPAFHTGEAGRPWSWQLGSDVLRFIDEYVEPGMSTLETGAGVSTVLFAARGARHTAIAPAPVEFERIRSFCQEHTVPLDHVTMLTERSEELLPGLETGDLDLVLIDGSHSFPVPFIDWYYTAAALKVGGHLVVDDVQLWTGRVLTRFLMEELGWTLLHDYDGRSALFLKEEPFRGLREWTDQSFVRRRSRPLELSVQIRHAIDLVRAGRYRTVLEKVQEKASRSSQ